MTIGVLTSLGYALFESVRFLTPALDAGLSTQTALPLVRELFVVGAHVGAGMILARGVDRRQVHSIFRDGDPLAGRSGLRGGVASERLAADLVAGLPVGGRGADVLLGIEYRNRAELEGERLATRSIQLGLPLDFAAILAKPLAFDQLFIVASKKVECIGHRPVFDCPKVSATDTRLTMDLACLAMLRQVLSPR